MSLGYSPRSRSGAGNIAPPRSSSIWPPSAGCSISWRSGRWCPPTRPPPLSPARLERVLEPAGISVSTSFLQPASAHGPTSATSRAQARRTSTKIALPTQERAAQSARPRRREIDRGIEPHQRIRIGAQDFTARQQREALPYPCLRNIKDVMLRLILWTDHVPERTARARIRHGPLPHRRRACRRPTALALVAASSEAALVVPGGWQIEGLPAISPARRAAGRRADDRVVVKFDGWPLLRRPARCAILGTCKSGQAHQDPSQTPTNQHSLRSSMLSVRPRAPRRTPSRSCLVVVGV